jgi:hypothetical protein
MGVIDAGIPLVRCSLDAPEEGALGTLRYVPLAEFELWRFLMETKHRRRIQVESVSVWVAESSGRFDPTLSVEDLEPVLRLRFEKMGDSVVPVPVERFFPAETYPEACAALLSHYGGPLRIRTTPGYFVPAGVSQRIVRPA